MMHGREKSDPEIVAVRTNAGGMSREKPANKAVPTAAELVERRAGTKGNAGQQSTLRAQDRPGVSQALDRIRQAARHNKKERFTTLLHHLGSRSRDTRVESICQISDLQKADFGCVSRPWRGFRLPRLRP